MGMHNSVSSHTITVRPSLDEEALLKSFGSESSNLIVIRLLASHREEEDAHLLLIASGICSEPNRGKPSGRQFTCRPGPHAVTIQRILARSTDESVSANHVIRALIRAKGSPVKQGDIPDRGSDGPRLDQSDMRPNRWVVLCQRLRLDRIRRRHLPWPTLVIVLILVIALINQLRLQMQLDEDRRKTVAAIDRLQREQDEFANEVAKVLIEFRQEYRRGLQNSAGHQSDAPIALGRPPSPVTSSRPRRRQRGNTTKSEARKSERRSVSIMLSLTPTEAAIFNENRPEDIVPSIWARQRVLAGFVTEEPTTNRRKKAAPPSPNFMHAAANLRLILALERIADALAATNLPDSKKLHLLVGLDALFASASPSEHDDQFEHGGGI